LSPAHVDGNGSLDISTFRNRHIDVLQIRKKSG